MRVARLVVALTAFAAFAACGGKPGKSICDNTVPPPAACMSQCDPSPAAPNSCPSGYHCAPDGFCDALCTPGGGECGDGYVCTTDGRCKGEGECEGLECNVTACMSKGKPETSISGTVYAPNGTLPLYGITVYIPNAPVGPFPDGSQCSRCSDDLPGSPLARATTDENGRFTITGNVPSGTNVPLIITSGKWRRQITIPSVGECVDTAAAPADTRLPKDKTEGDIPKIALTTGDADSLECLIRKLGIADSELTSAGGSGRVHYYRGDGVDAFATGWAGGATQLTSAGTLWNSAANLKPYDIVILSCEGSQQGTSSMKSQTDLNALKEYADLGGRVFLSHWHNIWIGGGFQADFNNPDPVIADWRPIAQWSDSPGTLANGTIDRIDENSNPKGTAFANWMASAGVMGSTTRGEIPVNDSKVTAIGLDMAKAERWTYVNRPAQEPQNFQFSTPVTVPLGNRCGKVVFSDMHVSGGPNLQNGNKFPNSCQGGTALTPQEKALAFMIFDLSSCVGVLL